MADWDLIRKFSPQLVSTAIKGFFYNYTPFVLICLKANYHLHWIKILTLSSNILQNSGLSLSIMLNYRTAEMLKIQSSYSGQILIILTMTEKTKIVTRMENVMWENTSLAWNLFISSVVFRQVKRVRFTKYSMLLFTLTHTSRHTLFYP